MKIVRKCHIPELENSNPNPECLEKSSSEDHQKMPHTKPEKCKPFPREKSFSEDRQKTLGNPPVKIIRKCGEIFQ